MLEFLRLLKDESDRTDMQAALDNVKEVVLLNAAHIETLQQSLLDLRWSGIIEGCLSGLVAVIVLVLAWYVGKLNKRIETLEAKDG